VYVQNVVLSLRYVYFMLVLTFERYRSWMIDRYEYPFLNLQWIFTLLPSLFSFLLTIWVTRRESYKKQEPLTICGHLFWPPVWWGLCWSLYISWVSFVVDLCFVSNAECASWLIVLYWLSFIDCSFCFSLTFISIVVRRWTRL
jgi:hypothetical protein